MRLHLDEAGLSELGTVGLVELLVKPSVSGSEVDALGLFGLAPLTLTQFRKRLAVDVEPVRDPSDRAMVAVLADQADCSATQSAGYSFSAGMTVSFATIVPSTRPPRCKRLNDRDWLGP